MEAVEPLARAVGRLGLMPRAFLTAADGGGPRLAVVETAGARTELVVGAARPGGTGGVGETIAHALRTAIGEGLERYCAARADPRALRVARASELGAAAVGGEAFATFSPAQLASPGFPYAAWDPEAPIRWAEGTCLATGARRFVPACAVYVPYTPLGPADLLQHAISTGQACHPLRARAILTGLLEVVERDHFATVWLRRLPVRRSDAARAPELAALAARCARSGVALHLLDLTLDLGVPVYLCLAEGERDGRTLYAAGAAARLDAGGARRKAALEALHTFAYARALVAERPSWRPAPGFADVVHFRDHVRLFAEPEARGWLAFLLDRPEEALAAHPAPCPPEALAAHLHAHGLGPIAVELTTPDVAALGVSVVKVVVPGMVPLTAAAPALGPARLTTVPRALGIRGALDLNPIPHPFP